MIDYRTWLEHGGKMPKHLPEKPLETNSQGGFDPQSDKQNQKFKKVDLLTLPEEVKGTNCGNCEYMRKQGKIGFCKHEDVQDWVTDRMCCNRWSHEGARRAWEKNQEGT